MEERNNRPPDAATDTAFDALLHVDRGRRIIEHESRTLAALAEALDESFAAAVQRIFTCRGSVIVSGMGKAGLIGQKIAATLASTGTRAHYLHPAEALHGDLGRIHRDDVVLMLSQSGETEEVTRLLPSLRDLGLEVVAVTANKHSTLGRAAAVTLQLGAIEEAGALRLAPSTSTTAMLAVGDALALVVSRLRGFRTEDFARFHPGGSLGRRLGLVEQYMRPLSACRVANEKETVRKVYVLHGLPGRRTGAIMLLDDAGRLAGIFTDSDLARLFEQRREAMLDSPIREVMTASPRTVREGTRMLEAVSLMGDRKLSELPVVQGDGQPIGILDITDVVSMVPERKPRAAARAPLRIVTEPDRRSA